MDSTPPTPVRLPLSSAQADAVNERIKWTMSQSEMYKWLSARANASRKYDGEPANWIGSITKSDVIEYQNNSRSWRANLDGGRIYCSGGSEYLILSNTDISSLEITTARQLKRLGVHASDIVDVTSSFHWVLGGTIIEGGARRLGATVVPGGPENTDLRIKVLADAGVSVVQAFTPYARRLGESIEANRLEGHHDLQVRLLIIGGEIDYGNSTGRVEDAWGGGVESREVYGTGETGLVAVECGLHREWLHVDSDYVVEVEEVDAVASTDSRPVAELIVSELVRSAQPFVRYRTGDLVSDVADFECNCGHRGQSIGRIVGRIGNLIRLKGQFVSPQIVESALISVGYVGAAEMRIQRTDHLDAAEIVLLQPTGVSAAAAEEAIKSRTGIGVQVRILPSGDEKSSGLRVLDSRGASERIGGPAHE